MTLTPGHLAEDEQDDALDGSENGHSVLNDLYTTPEPRRKSRRRRRKGGVIRRILKRFGVRRKVNGIVIGVVTVALIGLVIYAVLVVDSFTGVNTAITNLERILRGLEGQSNATISLNDYERLLSGVKEVNDSLRLSTRRLALIRPFSELHPNVSVMLQSLDIATTLSAAAERMLNGLQPAVFYLVAGDDENTNVAQLSSGDRLVELLEIGQGQFSRAQGELDAAKALIDSLNVQNASLDTLRTSERVVSFYEQISNINGVLMDSSDLLNVVLGLNGDRTYLVLAVNSDELRPSGGFLSTWGWFNVRNGRIAEFDYSESSATSPTPPDAAMAASFSIPTWWFDFRQPIYAAWDGSWNASFPATAERAVWYYNNGGNEHAPVDGVLSIDLYGFEYLLNVLGSVYLPDYEITVTSANFRQYVYDIRAFGLGPVPHKQFVADMYKQIMENWQTASRNPEQNALIMNALLRAIQEKHLMIYLADAELTTAIDLLGWSGRQGVEENSDYLMVVDSNLGNKSNRSVFRSLTYDVNLDNDGALAKRLTLSYEYPAEVADRDPAIDPEFHGPIDYSTMVQVYAPQGSDLVSYPQDIGFPSESTLDDLWLVSTIFRVPYNDSRRVQFQYTTPSGWTQFGNYGRYQLEIQKQAGTDGDSVTIQVTLPENTKIVESTPPVTTSFDLDRRVVEYHLTLTTDQTIDLIFEFTRDDDEEA